MIQDVQRLMDGYLSWLRDKTVLRQIEQWVEITTPYLDRHNDYIQIYVQKGHNGYTLTDDGYTLSDLEQSGCRMQSPKRRELLQMTLNGFGIQLENNALVVHTSAEKFSLQKHNLIQAILAVNDIFYLTIPTMAGFFFEDVAAWLDTNNIRYTPRVKFSGKSGFDHLFDFVIPKSRQQPERIIQTINRPGRDSAENVLVSWFDTKDVRPPSSRAYAFLNDSEQPVSASVIEALQNYELSPVPWSQRDKVREELAA